MGRRQGIAMVGTLLSSLSVVSAQALRHGWDRSRCQEELRSRGHRALELGGLDLVVDGMQLLPEGGYVAVYNESSWPDMAAQHTLYGTVIDRAAVAGVLGRLPYVRRGAELTGLALLPLGDRAGVERELSRLVDDLKGGARVFFGGEGGMSGIDGVKRFKRGAALLAIRSGRPLVPVAFAGSHRAMPWPSVHTRPGTIAVCIGPPLAVDGLTEEDARELADRAQRSVTTLYGQADAAQVAPKS